MTVQGDNKIGFFRFVKKALLFLAPFVIIFTIFDIMAFWFGELTPISSVIRAQNVHGTAEVLYGRKVVDQELRRYKFEMYQARPYDILAVGSSRILSIREEFFAPYLSFTNLGSIAHNLGDVEDLADRLATSSSRKYILFAPDYYWFGKLRSSTSELARDLTLPIVSLDWRAHIFASRYLIALALSNPGKISRYVSGGNPFRESFGLQGKEGNGYRADGSYQYSSFVAELRENNEYRDREQPPIIERVRGGTGSYAFDSPFDDSRLYTLARILKKLKSKNYVVIGVGLPFSSEVYGELVRNEHHKELFAKFQDNVPPVFAENGMRYFDYSDLKKLGIDDLYMFDGVHPSETASALILVDVLERMNDSDMINRRDILNRLRYIIASSKTRPFELDEERF